MLKDVRKSLYARRGLSKFNIVLDVIIVLLLIVLAAEICFNIFFVSIYVDGKSMYPTLNGDSGGDGGGDYVIINTYAKPVYGDIVVVKTHNDLGTDYNIIKRVIAMGGDAVKMESGVVYVKYAGQSDYTKLNEEYVSPDHCHPDLQQNSFEEWIVKEDCLFLLGDNRDDSYDSRDKGDFPIEGVVGVVTRWSLTNIGAVTSFFKFFKNTLPGFFKLG